LLVHIAELLAHLIAGPEKGDQKSCREPVKQVNQYSEYKDIHR
jgi:hypothetical protein